MTQKHATMVTALAKSGALILESLTPEKVHLLHMAIGISGESGELFAAAIMPAQRRDRFNLIEECGDSLFYLEGYYQGCGLERPEVVIDKNLVYTFDFARDRIVVLSADLLDFTKKWVIYDGELKEGRIAGILKELDMMITVFLTAFGSSVDAALKANMQKLHQRYKDYEYSDEAAANRADKPDEEAEVNAACGAEENLARPDHDETVQPEDSVNEASYVEPESTAVNADVDLEDQQEAVQNGLGNFYENGLSNP